MIRTRLGPYVPDRSGLRCFLPATGGNHQWRALVRWLPFIQAERTLPLGAFVDNEGSRSIDDYRVGAGSKRTQQLA